jgi:poly-gamma-glutamate biosynthesis protein PgsC/CapC
MGYEISFIGLLVSLLFIGITGVYPGGIIVPSYLVLFIDQPARIAGTLIAAFLTVLCFKLASQYLILFGKRRFVFMILIGGIWTFLWLQFLPFIFPASLEFRVIGWVIPGLIANHFERQGVIVTTASLVTVTVVIYFLGRMFYFIL